MSSASDFIIKNGILKKYVGPGGDVVIPESVTEIGNEAFADNKNITEICMHDGLQRVGKKAFYNCRQLAKITLSSQLVFAGEEAFSFCTNLKTLMLPDSLVVTNVDKIINDCWNLREIYIPRGAGIKATKDYEKLMGPWYLRLDGCNRIEKITAPHISCEQIAEKRVLAALWGYLCSPEIYCEHVVEDYQQSCFKFRKKLLPKLYTEDNVDGLRIFANTGKITLKNIDKDFLEPALVAGATQCVAFLLNLKNECTTSSKTPPRTNSIIKSTENKKKSVSPEERMLKKLWGFEEKNNKIRLLTYKGEETTVIIPAHIGQSAVAVIARGAFTGTYGHGSNRRERAISEIVSIEIQDGVREIQGAAFRWCNNLEMIKIPKSVKKIATYRFDETRKKLLSEPAFMGCPKLTIYAPAGSYAETYAKDNNIPFVAE